jgi:hypothetical protein
MSRGIGRLSPALVVACIALFVALGGSVYAATSIDGKTIAIRSLPGNRLAPGSVPGDRLKAGSIPGNRLAPGSITGDQIDPATLGLVPNAVHAQVADSAHDAQTALHAVSAIDAVKVNGHTAGCELPNRLFAGACWQVANSEAEVSAPAAALGCANQGGELPSALELAAFSQQPGIELDLEGEWTEDIASYTGPNAYSVATISRDGKLRTAVSTEARRYRCVIPLVS